MIKTLPQINIVFNNKTGFNLLGKLQLCLVENLYCNEIGVVLNFKSQMSLLGE